MNDSLHEYSSDRAPGEARGSAIRQAGTYLLGLVLALGLTSISFWAAKSHVLWGPGIPIGLCVLAVAQMGIHLVFFLHITSAPDNTNNVLALAFGVLIVTLVVAGSLWIMGNLNANMMPMSDMATLQAQP